MISQYFKKFCTFKDISRIWVGKLPKDSKYIKPYRVYYVLDGVKKTVDLIKVPDCVCLVIFNKTRKKLVFVRQFRPGKPAAPPKNFVRNVKSNFQVFLYKLFSMASSNPEDTL